MNDRPESMRSLLGSALALSAPLSALLIAAFPAAAQQADAIWACVDDQGHKIFQNVGNGRGCRRIDGLIATVPGTLPTPPSGPNAETRGVSPASFPRVDRDTQRLRDADRRRILEDELRLEQDRLARLRLDFNGGSPRTMADETTASPTYRERSQRLLEDIQRSEGYIASLKRELTPPRF